MDFDVFLPKIRFALEIKTGANDAIGTLVLRFENATDLEMAINNQSKWLKVKVN